MVSDVLLDAVESIDGYLKYKDAKYYPSELVRSKIIDMRDKMEAFALELARSPNSSDGDNIS